MAHQLKLLFHYTLGHMCGSTIEVHSYWPGKSHRDRVYMAIGIQSAWVMIRRIYLIMVIIILLSDKLAVLQMLPEDIHVEN